MAEEQLLLGRLAVHYKLISMDQLAEATHEQGKGPNPQRIGDIFVAKGWITPAQMKKLAAIQKTLLAKHRAEKAAEQAAPAPEPAAARVEGAPAPAPAAAPASKPALPARGEGDPVGVSPELLAILRDGASAGASDIHIHSGCPARFRCHGRLEVHGGNPIAAPAAEAMLSSILDAEQRERFEAAGEIDLAFGFAGLGRFRVNLYRQQNGSDGVFRLIPPEPPSLESLGLPTGLAKLANHHHGMVLITGPSGCGKSSTLAAMINILNEEHRAHILTVEDPIETLHPSRRSLVNQRQVGPHTESFARALRAALREDPDVIAIGELRDLETISLALTAAETGHFVLATLHTDNSIRTINRLVGAFPPDQQGQVRTMLSESLRAVVSQRLVERADGNGRVPALEILHVNKAVGNLIRENKTFQIHSILQTGGAQGMCLLDDSLAELVRSGTVTKAEALRYCQDAKRIPG